MSTFTTNPSAYKLSPEYRSRIWDQQCIVYHIATGETHLLEALSANIVQQLSLVNKQSISFDDLSRSILNSSDDNYTIGLLDTYLRQLTLLGIVLTNTKL